MSQFFIAATAQTTTCSGPRAQRMNLRLRIVPGHARHLLTLWRKELRRFRLGWNFADCRTSSGQRLDISLFKNSKDGIWTLQFRLKSDLQYISPDLRSMAPFLDPTRWIRTRLWKFRRVCRRENKKGLPDLAAL